MCLHWILMLTMTLLHCLRAHPISGNEEYNEIKELIDDLKKSGCGEPDSTFYCPSLDSECIVNALKCSSEELDKVRTECFEIDSDNSQAVFRTKRLINLMLEDRGLDIQAVTDTCFCEGKWPVEKSYNEFLDNIITLLQRLNSS